MQDEVHEYIHPLEYINWSPFDMNLIKGVALKSNLMGDDDNDPYVQLIKEEFLNNVQLLGLPFNSDESIEMPSFAPNYSFQLPQGYSMVDHSLNPNATLLSVPNGNNSFYGPPITHPKQRSNTESMITPKEVLGRKSKETLEKKEREVSLKVKELMKELKNIKEAKKNYGQLENQSD